MAKCTFKQVEHMVDQLSPHEQAHLLASLAFRMAQAVTKSSHSAAMTPQESNVAWEEFFRIGDQLPAGDSPVTETMTSALISMRR